MINVCIVGYGAVGKIHAEAVSKLENVRLYAICDISVESADIGAKKYNCKALYDFEKALQDKSIDSIHVCTPHYLHFDMIKAAVTVNKAVVAEKPVTMKHEEFEFLIKNYAEADIFPIFQNRTNCCIRTLKSILSSDNTLGELIGIKGILTWHRDEEYYDSAEWRGTKAFEGGGVLINQALHTLDLMTYLAGEAEDVTATASNKSLNGIIEVEDTLDAYIKFKNGAAGIFYATNSYIQDSSVFIELVFENTVFKYIDNKLYRNGDMICKDEAKCLGKAYWGAGHERTLYDYYVLNKKMTLYDIKPTMDTMFAIYESAKRNTEVRL